MTLQRWFNMFRQVDAIGALSHIIDWLQNTRGKQSMEEVAHHETLLIQSPGKRGSPLENNDFNG